MEDKEQQLQAIHNTIEKTRAAYANMSNFSAWDWSAYKVESHEKDVVINALGFYLRHLERREEELHDDTEIRE